MTVVAVEELGRNLHDYARRAAEGETVLIVEAERIVARLAPAPELPDWIRDNPRLVREGVITLPTNPDKTPPARVPGVAIPLEQILRDLDEDRADRC